MRTLIALVITILLSACVFEKPETQCLNSFKSTLKDPDSGKVISFNPPELTYSATNSYGARIQGKALCQEYKKEWSRDYHAEKLAIMNRSTEKLKASNECRFNGGNREECAGDSLAIRHRTFSGTSLDDLHKESERELGFN